tara:strand:- start:38 stop:877 length:840 start_codon:yes stop_codon:yes gene_type:complete
MDNFVFLIVLLAAILHASWNGMVKNHSDKVVAVVGIIFGHVPFSIIAIILLPAPSPESIPYIIVSIFVHQGYQWFLVSSYQIGDLTKVYPIARGTGPLVATLVSILFLGLILDITTILAILIICFGIIILSVFDKSKKNFTVIKYSLITGLFIASYSLVDGYGARISQSAISFISWSFLINAIIFPFALGLRNEKNVLKRVYNEGKQIFLIGILFSYTSYVLVVWAFTKAPIPVVTSLRETSILFTLLIGYFFLKEKITPIKIFSILMILSGVIALKLL